MPSTRQLAAIMFTDIVGYTALMGEDEQKGFELLRKNRELQKPLIEQHSGKWIKELGDGVLASFNTVTDAVSCACSIIKGCDSINALKLRIGIHLGDILFEEGDVFGDGVNIASRIQAIAPIGGIWVSEPVYACVVNKKDIKAKFIRAESLKHVKEPVRIYEIITGASISKINVEGTEPAKTFVEKSLAVLPFTDMSPAKDQAYLGDGIAEELLTLMSQVKRLKVIGRTSSFSFKNKDVDLKTIGKTLNADTILEGSIQKAGNRVRITAQLVNAEDSYHIWSQRYDRELDDIFALQDDICSKIAEHLKLTLLQKHKTAVDKKPTENLEAYELYLKGEFYYKKYSADGFQKAIDYFNKAAELDPNYTDAWWSLSQACWETQAWLPVQDKDVIEKARACAIKAIDIDEKSANAHFMLALIYMNADWNWEKAGAEIALGNKYKHTNDFWFLPLEPWYRGMLLGDFDFAISRLQEGIENDPLSIFYLSFLALMNLYGTRNYEETRILVGRILELDPHYIEAWRLTCLSYLFEGNYVLAEEYAHKYYDALEGKGQGASSLIMCLAASGKTEKAEQLYRVVQETLPSSEFSAKLRANVYAYLGRFDDAFEQLHKAIDEKDIWLPMTIKYAPEWDLLRSDPRFQIVLNRMKFPISR
jgi:TolB-like protein/class 3 adenylate cyclase